MTLDPTIFARVAEVVREHFEFDGEVTPETTARDVYGWDSLAHTIVVMKVEDEFGVELPERLIFGLRNVGELALAIQERAGA